MAAFADHPADWTATPGAPGINYIPISLAAGDFAAVQQVLAAARQQADVVICALHWGPNMRARPTPAFREFAHAVLAAGADIVWGTSAHVVQGIEIRQGRLILYDTGDFVDDYVVDPDLRNDLSAVFLVHLRPPTIVGLELVPVAIGNRRVKLASGADRAWFAGRIAALCAEMGTTVTDRGTSLSVTGDSGQ